MAASKELQLDLGAVLAWAELEIEKIRFPRDGKVKLCGMLEAKYRLYSRHTGATWQDYLRREESRPMPWKLIKRLYFRHRHSDRPTTANEPATKRHPRLKARAAAALDNKEQLKAERELEKVQESIWQELGEVEDGYQSARLVMLSLVSPKFHRRLMKLQQELRLLVIEASRDRTDTKQTALLGLLDPAYEELGG